MGGPARLLSLALALLALHGVAAAGTDYKADTLSVLLFTGVFVLCLLITYVLLQSRLAYLPESLVHIFLGIVIGGIIYGTGREIEDLIAFNPRTFFLFLLPPIVFHAGYDLHKGNFFKNLGSILVFAVLGTLVSAFVFGGIIYALGKAHLSKEVTFLESLVFGSIVACIDPVATLAIFTALNVEPTLHMLVFGESVLNDAVSITLYRTFAEYAAGGAAFHLPELGLATLHFCIITFGSVFIGIATAAVSALVHKYIHLKMYPSLEISFVFVFAYIPYLIAEVLKLSGVMSILFGGIVMAHYTHFNLSPVSQITVQQAFHMFAYICETTVFIYLGMAVFGYSHSFHGGLIFWSIVLAFLARAANVFPLGALVNQFRTVKISREHMFVLWFSGLRGALAFAMALNFGNPHIMSATLIMCLFTIITLGGSTLPLLKYLSRRGGQVFNSKISIGMTEMVPFPPRTTYPQPAAGQADRLRDGGEPRLAHGAAGRPRVVVRALRPQVPAALLPLLHQPALPHAALDPVPPMGPLRRPRQGHSPLRLLPLPLRLVPAGGGPGAGPGGHPRRPRGGPAAARRRRPPPPRRRRDAHDAAVPPRPRAGGGRHPRRRRRLRRGLLIGIVGCSYRYLGTG